jgi:hypothetical protein
LPVSSTKLHETGEQQQPIGATNYLHNNIIIIIITTTIIDKIPPKFSSKIVPFLENRIQDRCCFRSKITPVFLPKTESKITATAAAFGPRSQLLSSENRIEHR